MIEVFQYPKCGTCKKAIQWLDARGVEYRSVDIVDHPPSLSKLKRAHKLSQLPIGKLFNTSGQSYRQGNFKQKLQTMSDAEALEALSQDGKLIKRPLVLGSDFALVGFKQEEYEASF